MSSAAGKTTIRRSVDYLRYRRDPIRPWFRHLPHSQRDVTKRKRVVVRSMAEMFLLTWDPIELDMESLLESEVDDAATQRLLAGSNGESVSRIV